MASDGSTVDYILDQLRSGGVEASAKKMFGEYGLYVEGRMVALVCDDQLFVKPVPGTAAMLDGFELAAPYPQAKPHPQIDGDRWDDADWLAQLFRITSTEVPAPKAKKR